MAGLRIGERTGNSSRRIPIQWASVPTDRLAVWNKLGPTPAHRFE
jgi:hypothetical protein